MVEPTLRTVTEQLESVQELFNASEGLANQGFQELRPAWFLGPQGSDWKLYIDDEPLVTQIVHGTRLWQWSPGFYAGTVSAELIDPNGHVANKYLLDVSPDPAKLGQAAFAELVHDIRDFEPSLVYGWEPPSTAVGSEAGGDDLNIQCARLLQYGPPLVKALGGLQTAPHRVLHSIRALRPGNGVRAIDTHTLRAALRNPTALSLLKGAYPSDPSREDERTFLDVPLVQETLDSAANRCMVAILRAVTRRASHLKGRFEELSRRADDEDTRTSVSARWPRRKERIDQIVLGVSRGLASHPLRDVSRSEISAAGLTAIAAHPLYSRVQRLAWKILRPGIYGEAAGDLSWMSPTWEIFERWCFVQLSKALESTHVTYNWRLLGGESTSFRFQGKGGGKTLTLYLQPSFSYAATPSSSTGFWSVSSNFIPDLVLVVEAGKSARWFVFDAKYRQKKNNVLDAMRSAHLYHDALRRFDSQAERSLLLIPASSPEANWLASEKYQAKHAVGTAVLSRGGKPAEDLLERISV